TRARRYHGVVFTVTSQHSKRVAKLGAVGYDALILLNSFVKWCLKHMNREKMSFSKRIKTRFKDAVKFINDFEGTAAELAAAQGYGYVVCGHIHQPEQRIIPTAHGEVLYLNSGDWVENLTALEYHQGTWKIFRYQDALLDDNDDSDLLDTENLNSKLDVRAMLLSFSA